MKSILSLVAGLAFIAYLPTSLASLALSASYPGVSYGPPGHWTPSCPPPPQHCFDGCAAFFDSGEGIFTFVFPSPSTTFQWWAYPRNDIGLATLCIDGTNCRNVSYVVAGSNPNTSPPVLITSITGLTNTTHTITITNIADTVHGDEFGQMNVDHVVIDGTPVTVPTMAPGTIQSMIVGNTVPTAFHLNMQAGASAGTLNSTRS